MITFQAMNSLRELIDPKKRLLLRMAYSSGMISSQRVSFTKFYSSATGLSVALLYGRIARVPLIDTSSLRYKLSERNNNDLFILDLIFLPCNSRDANDAMLGFCEHRAAKRHNEDYTATE